MVSESDLVEGREYIIMKNNLPLYTCLYVGKKMELNDETRLTEFIVFLRFNKLLNEYHEEGYELKDGHRIDSTISIVCL